MMCIVLKFEYWIVCKRDEMKMAERKKEKQYEIVKKYRTLTNEKSTVDGSRASQWIKNKVVGGFEGDI